MTGSTLSARIASRATGVGLSLDISTLEQLERYYLLLQRWNGSINLTALPLQGYSDATLDRLLIEPLLASVYVDQSPLTWVDFGSGGGSPAIPLKIVRPQTSLTMIESRERKSAFLREAASSLRLANTSVITTRIENLTESELRGAAELVTLRAISLGPRILASAAAVLRVAGQLLVFKGNIPLVFSNFPFTLAKDVLLVPPCTRLAILQKVSHETKVGPGG